MSELMGNEGIENNFQMRNPQPQVALAGNPNCGKTALFNAITGGRAKVGNYPGVTVERKEGHVLTASGLNLSVLDLPGTYSLDARTPDELITRNILLGIQTNEKNPDVLVAVADATNLERSLGLVFELCLIGKPIVLVLNMMDLAKKRGLELDLEILSQQLGVPVIPTVAVRKNGISELLYQVERLLASESAKRTLLEWKKPTTQEIRQRFAEIDRILALCTRQMPRPTVWTDRMDRVVLHSFFGPILLGLIFAAIFQVIFIWATQPMEWIKSAMNQFGRWVGLWMGPGPLQSLITDGMIAGMGSVLVFLPQILFLFTFILLLEDSGYMSRAAFLMDRLMGKVGLNGRAFIPLLSSFACAIPGVMATRTIENRRDRLITILVAPLMTCSARLPVYSLLIAAFIPNKILWRGIRLQGVVMFLLYVFGVISALLVARVLKGTVLKGKKPLLLMELPTYKWPSPKNIFIGLIERSKLFVRRAGTVILSVSIVLWFLSSYPKPPQSQIPRSESAISYSYAGRIGKAMEPWVKPIGFNWKIAVALIPGFAAREVMVGSLATVYAVEGKSEEPSPEALPKTLSAQLSRDWSLATALSLLVWYVLACQCLSTLAVTRRETGSWKWPAFMLTYMTGLAYLGSFLTYHFAVSLGLG